MGQLCNCRWKYVRQLLADYEHGCLHVPTWFTHPSGVHLIPSPRWLLLPSMYKGFAETLYKKLKPLPGCRGVNLKVVANGNRDIMAWQGASVIASMDSFMNVRKTRRVAHKRFLHALSSHRACSRSARSPSQLVCRCGLAACRP